MSSKFQDSERSVGDSPRDELGPSRPQNAEKSATDPDLRRRARQTTWTIYHECGDADAVQLFEEAKELGGGGPEIGRRLELALPEWCGANKTREELCALLEGQFSEQPETRQAAVDEIRLRVQSCCIDFARTRFGDNEEARELGGKLGVAAWSALDLPQLPKALAAVL
jgi:hypothetical protein